VDSNLCFAIIPSVFNRLTWNKMKTDDRDTCQSSVCQSFEFVRLLMSGHGAIAVENAALRLQLAAFQRQRKRPVLTSFDRLFWVSLSLIWNGWRAALAYELLTAPWSPWQNPYAERLIGSIRRDCLNHFVIRNARHLKRTLASYFAYYHGSRTHLGLAKQCAFPRQVSSIGRVIVIPQLGGLHHRYERVAA
jgi:Integrase core domain